MIDKAKKKAEEKEKEKKLRKKSKMRPDVFEMARCLGTTDAIFLLGLMELKDRHSATPIGTRIRDELDRPWFPCSLLDVQNLILFDIQKQKRYFKIYRGLGVISLQMVGFPSHRYIKLNFPRLKEVLRNIRVGQPATATKEDIEEEKTEDDD